MLPSVAWARAFRATYSCCSPLRTQRGGRRVLPRAAGESATSTPSLSSASAPEGLDAAAMGQAFSPALKAMHRSKGGEGVAKLLDNSGNGYWLVTLQTVEGWPIPDGDLRRVRGHLRRADGGDSPWGSPPPCDII